MYEITLRMDEDEIEQHLGYAPDISEDPYAIIGILRDYAPIHADDLKVTEPC